MTATLTPPSTGRATTGEDQPRRRPLALLAILGGLAAAGCTLATGLALGIVGWFLADGGIHGEPRDALRVGALGWLTAHGSGVTVLGVAITAVPLGVTLVCAWVIWRFALGLGEAVSGHGPNATTWSDGDRDWTVAAASLIFGATYLLIATVTAVLAGDATTAPSLFGVWVWSLGLIVLFAVPGVAVGSGRAAQWLSLAHPSVRAVLRNAAVIGVGFLGCSMLAFVAAFILDFGGAANVFSRLHTDTGDAVMISLLILTLLPNAVIFSGAYLLGPGFTVGTGTLVSPSVVAVGPVPAFPLLAALPDNGPVPGWTPYLIVIPGLIALLATMWCQRRMPTTAWDQGALRGLVGGVVAAIGFAVLAAVAGGAVGPGRMSDVGPLAMQVLLNGIVTMGLGGLLGGLLATWWQRRGAPNEPDPAEAARRNPDSEDTIRIT